jgi:hypothetical protein
LRDKYKQGKTKGKKGKKKGKKKMGEKTMSVGVQDASPPAC